MLLQTITIADYRYARARDEVDFIACMRPDVRSPYIPLREFYLCYCEAGFAEGQLGDAQILLAREG
jgi:hypothetical protein